MYTKTKKILKIVGIIFLVCIIAFGATFATIKMLKKERVCAHLFEDSFTNQIETKTDIFSSASNEEIQFSKQIEFLQAINNNLNLRFDYILPNFYSIGLNASEQKAVKKDVAIIQTSVENLENNYANLKNLYSNFSASSTTEITNYFKNYCESFQSLIKAKNSLLTKLFDSLNKHKITLTPYAENVFQTSNILSGIAIDFNLPLLTKTTKSSSATNKTTALLTQINQHFGNFLNKTSPSLNVSYISLINQHRIANKNLQEKFNAAKEALNKLNEKEIETLFEAGVKDYLASSDNTNLTTIYEFLRDGGEYMNSITPSLNNGINLF